MARLVYSSAAVTDLAEIAAYIAEAAGEMAPAKAYTGRLRARCNELSLLPFPIGRARPELGNGLRSHTFGNYVLFFQTSENIFLVVGIIEGHRDISTVFADRP